MEREFDDVAKVTSHVVDIESHRSPFEEVWAEFFDESCPCHAAVGVVALAEPE